ncbi:MAG: PilZ domain-containing protein [Treponema sp.]|jgi:hypothetical protein|nr:PilZ domain-containing protein [Treponema sp.]
MRDREPLGDGPFSLRRAGRDYGLDREGTRLLDFVLRTGPGEDPRRILKSQTLLDRHFKAAYTLISQETGKRNDSDERLARLLSLRKTLEVSRNKDKAPETPELHGNMPAIIWLEDEGYPVRLLAIREDRLLVENPRNALGDLILVEANCGIRLAFFIRSSRGFALTGKALKRTESPWGPALELLRKSPPALLNPPLFRFRELELPCSLSPVRLEETGIDESRRVRLVPEGPDSAGEARTGGTALHLSLEGCAVRTALALEAGTLVKVELKSGELGTVLAQVQRLNRNGGNVLQLRFLKLSLRSANALSAALFGYLD